MNFLSREVRLYFNNNQFFAKLFYNYQYIIDLLPSVVRGLFSLYKKVTVELSLHSDLSLYNVVEFRVVVELSRNVVSA